MERGYNHIQQSDSQLNSRLVEITRLEKTVQYTEERRAQLGHEAACIAFELMARSQDQFKREEEVAWLDASYEQSEDCPTTPIDTETINKMLNESKGDGTDRFDVFGTDD